MREIVFVIEVLLVLCDLYRHLSGHLGTLSSKWMRTVFLFLIGRNYFNWVEREITVSWKNLKSFCSRKTISMKKSQWKGSTLLRCDYVSMFENCILSAFCDFWKCTNFREDSFLKIKRNFQCRGIPFLIRTTILFFVVD